jgi:hypothetical protein
MVIDTYTHNIGLNEPLVKQIHITHLFFFFFNKGTLLEFSSFEFFKDVCNGMEFDLVLNHLHLKFLVKMIKIEKNLNLKKFSKLDQRFH